MSGEAFGCTCLASFPTAEALESHLDDYKSQIDYYSARLELCRTHQRANDHDRADSDDDCNDPDKTIKYCPHETCLPSKTFAKGQGLRRHFATHVRCNEVCVFCHKICGFASEFIRHANFNHLDQHGTKRKYMQQISQELSKEVARKLHHAKRACMKRRSEEADIGAETSEARRARLESVPAKDHNNSYYVDQHAMEVATGIVAAPIATFEELVALENHNRAALATTDASAIASNNFKGATQEFYMGSEQTQGGRYHPDITRVANWPAGWDL